MKKKPRSKPLQLDSSAQSASPSQPAFLAKPPGAPAYHGFPLIEATRTDGFCYGAITKFEEPEGCCEGDGFVEAPDGSRAGLVWQVGKGEMRQVLAPDDKRWGVWGVWFPKPVKNVDDLTMNFRHILPALKETYQKIRG